jgi:hypothetical protein
MYDRHFADPSFDMRKDSWIWLVVVEVLDGPSALCRAVL